MLEQSMVMSLEARAEKLLSRTEAMVLLCSKASTYWSMIASCRPDSLKCIILVRNSGLLALMTTAESTHICFTRPCATTV